MNRNIPILLIVSLCTMALLLSPVSATKHTYPVNYVVDSGQVVPYIDIGYGHTGNWRIWGWINYSGQSFKYIDSGHVVSIFSRYWGYGKSAPNLRNAAFDSYADF